MLTDEERIQGLELQVKLLQKMFDDLHKLEQSDRKAIMFLLDKMKKLEQHNKVTTECINTQADRIDRLMKEVFDEDPPTEEEDTTPDDGGDDRYEAWKDDRDNEEGLL